MASAARQRLVGYVPQSLYLEFDLAIKIRPASAGTNHASEVLESTARPAAIPESFRRTMDSNFALAKGALLALLDSKGVAVLDAERFRGPGYRHYLAQKRERCVAASAGLVCGEPVQDRFWQIRAGPTTDICPPPTTISAPDSASDPVAYSLDYPYTSLIIRSPVMDCYVLDQKDDSPFIQELATSPDSWTGREAGGRCTWKEVQYVLHQLNSCCLEDAGRFFTIVAPQTGVRDNGTNTSLRIMLECGRMPAESLFQNPFTELGHGDMSLLQAKRIALFMWFFESHLHTLCHPHQAVIRGQSVLFPLWARHGPLSRPLSHLSLAALEGARMAVPVLGLVLHGLLQYAPRTMFDHMPEYKKLSKLWEVLRPMDLNEQLRVDCTVDHRGSPIISTVLSAVNCPVLRFDVNHERDIDHKEVKVPFVAIGGFQCVSFDVFLFRAAARLARCCVRASRLERENFQRLLAGIQETPPEDTMEVIDFLGEDVDLWKKFIESYAGYWTSL
ncbi:hypothetical protein CMQ_7599 [Grosmannia clavigera kw1407]|uniref:Uncharacterized protein n=1 Tax=Grosmannia clavigera (strain kw1407 / UAMH 11150) TaxID=655863 RepID=F0XPC0_GROCL|nr:uncharacterized protein CMQ_7599 [Grosmannia clavigera kw1407]EFX00597.1 hypothetical protein CMQ_7599 [Grosmannia clavigera kw1407]